MPKNAKQTKPVGGPFLAAAVLCQNVIEDVDGVFSAVRIVDEIQIGIRPDAPPDFPSKANPLEIALFALIMIRRGDARAGKHKIQLVTEHPDGTTKVTWKGDLEMPPYPNGTATLRIRMAMKLHTEGVFWVDVVLGRERLTRMALNLKIQRPAPSAAAGQ